MPTSRLSPRPRRLDRPLRPCNGEETRRLARAVGDTVFEFRPQSADTHSMRELIDAIEARKASALATIDRELDGRGSLRLPPLGKPR